MRTWQHSHISDFCKGHKSDRAAVGPPISHRRSIDHALLIRFTLPIRSGLADPMGNGHLGSAFYLSMRTLKPLDGYARRADAREQRESSVLMIQRHTAPSSAYSQSNKAIAHSARHDMPSFVRQRSSDGFLQKSMEGRTGAQRHARDDGYARRVPSSAQGLGDQGVPLRSIEIPMVAPPPPPPPSAHAALRRPPPVPRGAARSVLVEEGVARGTLRFASDAATPADPYYFAGEEAARERADACARLESVARPRAYARDDEMDTANDGGQPMAATPVAPSVVPASATAHAVDPMSRASLRARTAPLTQEMVEAMRPRSGSVQYKFKFEHAGKWRPIAVAPGATWRQVRETLERLWCFERRGRERTIQRGQAEPAGGGARQVMRLEGFCGGRQLADHETMPTSGELILARKDYAPRSKERERLAHMPVAPRHLCLICGARGEHAREACPLRDDPTHIALSARWLGDRPLTGMRPASAEERGRALWTELSDGKLAFFVRDDKPAAAPLHPSASPVVVKR